MDPCFKDINYFSVTQRQANGKRCVRKCWNSHLVVGLGQAGQGKTTLHMLVWEAKRARSASSRNALSRGRASFEAALEGQGLLGCTEPSAAII